MLSFLVISFLNFILLIMFLMFNFQNCPSKKVSEIRLMMFSSLICLHYHCVDYSHQLFLTFVSSHDLFICYICSSKVLINHYSFVAYLYKQQTWEALSKRWRKFCWVLTWQPGPNNGTIGQIHGSAMKYWLKVDVPDTNIGRKWKRKWAFSQ